MLTRLTSDFAFGKIKKEDPMAKIKDEFLMIVSAYSVARVDAFLRGLDRHTKNIILDSAMPQAFRLAAAKGDDMLMEYFWNVVPDRDARINLLQGYMFGAFWIAAEYGHVNVLEKLWGWASKYGMCNEMLSAYEYGAFLLAVGFKKIDAIKKLLGFALDKGLLEDVLTIEDYYLFKIAATSGDIEVLVTLFVYVRRVEDINEIIKVITEDADIPTEISNLVADYNKNISTLRAMVELLQGKKVPGFREADEAVRSLKSMGITHDYVWAHGIVSDLVKSCQAKPASVVLADLTIPSPASSSALSTTSLAVGSAAIQQLEQTPLCASIQVKRKMGEEPDGDRNAKQSKLQ